MALDINRTQQLMDVIHGTIQYSGIESAVISTPVFNRLHRVLQSSMVFLTYSSNKVKRFEHSIGTMHLAGRIFYQSFVNTSNQEVLDAFLKEMETEIINWYADADLSSHPIIRPSIIDTYSPATEEILNAPYPRCVVYRDFSPVNLEKDKLFPYLVFFQAVRLAGLLHDIGHFPYSHILEDAIRELYLRVAQIPEEKRNQPQKSFLSIIGPYYKDRDSIRAIHEEIGKTLLHQITTDIAGKVPGDLGDERIFLTLVFDFAGRILESSPADNTIFSDLHWIVAGTVDADRLDYCSRDLFCAGMRRDIYPYDRLLYTYRIARHQLQMDMSGEGISQDVRPHFLFCPGVKCVPEVEDLLERRNLVFSQINYHHRVHKHEVIFSNVLANIGFQELEKLDRLPQVRSGQALPLEISSIWVLVQKLQNRRTFIDYLVIQLDDSWMDTLLKNAFFQTYGTNFRNMEVQGSNPEWSRFDELISSTKRYYSCFKRLPDFREFDQKFCMKLEEGIEKHEDSGLDRMFRDALETAKEQISLYKAKQGQDTLVFNHWLDLLTDGEGAMLFRQMEERLNKKLKEQPEIQVQDCFVRSCRFGLGLKTSRDPVMFWVDENKPPVSLEAFSALHKKFSENRKFSPSFHLYYLPAYDRENQKYKSPEVSRLLELLAEIAAGVMWEYFELAVEHRRAAAGK